jgi:hypothetical protein
MYLFLNYMETKEATKVGCQSCKSDKGVKRVQKFMFITGGVVFALAIYGSIRLVQDIMSLF